MLPLSGERLLTACEHAQSEPAVLRAITLLAAALPEHSRDDLLHQSLTERNRLLLQLHRISFGSSLDGYVACAQCGAAMELSLSVADVLAQIDESHAPASLPWLDGDQTRSMRAATTADLLAAAQAPDEAAAEEHLLLRCLGMDTVALTADSMQMARSHFEQLHAGGELRCALHCPDCSHAATYELDLAHFVWREALHTARRLLGDIHALALNYGWREQDIAAMSPVRREAYLELLGT